MDERVRRAGLNEAIFREVNEQIESLNRGIAAISDNMLHVVCECGELQCSEQLPVPLEVYSRVRSDPVLFVVLPGHEKPDVEDVVERTARYCIVRKHEGDPARIAEATDPRSD
jgi:hypothetical protein